MSDEVPPARGPEPVDSGPVGLGPVGLGPVGLGPGGSDPPAHLAAAAAALFGDRLPLAVRYAEALMTDGVVRGLIGPREAPRMWDRHVLNCAAVAELISPGATVVDVGSGAGLPGIVLSVARPDISVVLLEPLARRTAFLSEVVAALGLDRTTVVRARAEDCGGQRGAPRVPPADVVTARAVAPLDRLTAWCLPLTAVGGRLLALKGDSAAAEVTEHREVIGQLGGRTPTVLTCGTGVLDDPTTVVEIVRERIVDAGRGSRARPATRSKSPARRHPRG